MNIWDIFQNPIMIGLFAGILTYIYMKWRNKKDQKKHKKNKNKNKKDINLLIPFAVFIVFWFISYAYLSSCDETIDTKSSTEVTESVSKSLLAEPQLPLPLPSKFNGTADGSDLSSVNLVSTGIQIPHKLQLPDTLFSMQ
jgi:heme/copper-type cytochrome/quinol oxidase subunit 2